MSDDQQHQQPASTFPGVLSSFLPLGAAVVAIALGWGEMRNQMKSEQQFREDSVRQLSVELSRIGVSYDKLEDRARVLEEQSARIDERFSMILALMNEVKVQVATLTAAETQRNAE